MLAFFSLEASPPPRGWFTFTFGLAGFILSLFSLSDLDKVCVAMDPGTDVITTSFPQGAEPLWPVSEQVADAKMVHASKARVLLSFSAYNWWTRNLAQVHFHQELRLSVWQQLAQVRETYWSCSDLYPLVEEVTRNTSLARLTDALLSLANLKAWYFSPLASRVWSPSLVIHRFHVPDVQPRGDAFFMAQLRDFNHEAKLPPSCLPPAALRKEKRASRGRAWNARSQTRGGKKVSAPVGRGNSAPVGRGRGAGKAKAKKCFSCGALDHIKRDCPKKKSK